MPIRSMRTTLIVVTLLCASAASDLTVPEAGPDQMLLDRNGDGVELVVLDAAGSTADTETITGYCWLYDNSVLGNTAFVSVELPVGTHTITLMIFDTSGQMFSDTITATIEPLTGQPQLLNLADAPTTSRFPLPADRVWPAEPGAADICLWADDKFAAISITIDDNLAGDHDWWIQMGEQFGYRFTWFVITGRVGTEFRYGTWEGFRNLTAMGHSIQSHTVTHSSADHVRPEDEVTVEYHDSLAMINQNIPLAQADTIGYPYGNLNREVSIRYNLAGRGTYGAPNKANRIDYIKTNSCGEGLDADHVNSVLLGTSNISWLSGGAYRRGWLCTHYHTVGDRAATENHLANIAANDADLWVGLFRDVIRYGQERDTAVLTVTANTAERIAMTLTDQMDDVRYDFPLTVKVRLHPAWTTAFATQDGAPVDAAVIEHAGARFALVKAVPDRGLIELTPTAALAGDADGDGDVDLDDFVALKTHFGSGTNRTQGDFDGDGDVDLEDFVILKTNFGTTSPQP